MANTSLIKRSSVASKVPTTSDLSLGELAVNTYDGKLFLKKSVSGTESIVDLTDADKLDGQDGSYYTGYTDTAISNLIDSSPAALNTLNELAAALNDDASFSTTVTNSIATKLPLAGGTLTGTLTISNAAPNLLFTDSDHNPDFGILASGGQFRIQDTTNTANLMTLDSSKIQAVVNLDALAGIDVTGTCTATTFSGSGASLTNIPAAQLTGVLPALDGSNLTGLTVNNANTLDNLDSTQFLRSDTNDTINGLLTVGGSSVSGSEGGELRLTHAPDGSLSGSEVKVDVFNNLFRIFEGGGNARGFRLDITQANNYSNTKIWHEGNDGSGSGLDADTLDGVQGSSYLRSDTNDTFSGDLTVTGAIVASGDLTIDTNTLHVDSSSNRVGIGTTSPIRPLSIGSYGSGTNAEITLASTTTGYGSILFGDGGTGTDIYRGYLQYLHQHDKMLIATSSTARITILSGGTVQVAQDLEVGAGIDITGNITATGNITVSGTVDGRDVASDGSKLDTYEANGSSYLRSDADDTTSGHLTLSDSGYSIGDEYHIWKRNYVVNSSNPQELLDLSLIHI